MWGVASGYDMAVRHFVYVADGVETYVNTPYLIGNPYQHTWQGLITGVPTVWQVVGLDRYMGK